MVGICKLADYGSRFNYVKDLDNSYMAKLIQFETSRLATSEQELTIRRENLRVLEQTDDEQIISTSLVHFQDHLAQLRFDLKSAEKEEEIAKQVSFMCLAAYFNLEFMNNQPMACRHMKLPC